MAAIEDDSLDLPLVSLSSGVSNIRAILSPFAFAMPLIRAPMVRSGMP